MGALDDVRQAMRDYRMAYGLTRRQVVIETGLGMIVIAVLAVAVAVLAAAVPL